MAVAHAGTLRYFGAPQVAGLMAAGSGTGTAPCPTMRFSFACISTILLSACFSGGDGDEPGPVKGPDGEPGICCPVADFSGCSPGPTPLPAGGWAASLDQCNRAVSGYDGPPVVADFDEYGCAILYFDESAGCCGCVNVDGGMDAAS
jgi:hypothetical protein